MRVCVAGEEQVTQRFAKQSQNIFVATHRCQPCGCFFLTARKARLTTVKVFFPGAAQFVSSCGHFRCFKYQECGVCFVVVVVEGFFLQGGGAALGFFGFFFASHCW